MSAINGSKGLARGNKYYIMMNPPPFLSGASTSGSNIPMPSNKSSGGLLDALIKGAGNILGFAGQNEKPQRTVPGDTPRLLSYLCNTASLPGITFQGIPVKRQAIGPEEFFPLAPTYEDVQLGFLVDGAGKVLQFFHQWMQNIVNVNPDNPIKGAYPWEVYYRDNYAIDIDIYWLNETGDAIIGVTLREAFPISMGSVALSWMDNDSVAQLPITFKYKSWTSTLFDTSGSGLEPDRGSSILKMLAQAGTVAALVSSMKRPTTIGQFVNAGNNLNLMSKAF